jgi:pantetheine-phosphate adenylyltransferase
MKEAIYAVSGDPWTKGHTDIVRRALQIFDRVIVAIGVNPKKSYTFPLEMRKKLAQYSLTKFMDQIEVVSFEGLLVDFAYTRGVKTIIRGIRDDIDFNFEKSMFQVNITQKGVDEIFLFPRPEVEFISSSAVRELQRNQGDITKYVDLRVKQAMEVHLSNQRLIGITGTVGAGKTYMANKLCEIGRKNPDRWKMDFHNIELDAIGRDLLSKDTRPFAKAMRHKLIEAWQDNTLLVDPNDPQCFLDKKKVASKIFSQANALETYNSISKDPILFELQNQLRGKTGFIFINSALLIEAGLTKLCNNNVLFITAPEEFRISNLESRGYTKTDLSGRMKGQFSGSEKIGAFSRILGENGPDKDWGQFFSLHNTPNLDDRDLLHTLEQLVNITECL